MSNTDLLELLADISRGLKDLAACIDAYLEKAKPVEVRLAELREAFPEDLRVLVDFEAVEGRVVIKPKRFLGRENFTRISEIVKQAGGEYVSAGRESHFLVPKR